ncbi:ParB N-terminal domain-containing protein [Lentzea sp. NPDC060358]|uniref:ParB/RepB/Spo0J family partition protein n=1 Tax=Lentzea sp. NPDC060358 TaxID=3347103 RepID=UPI0036464384
MSSRFVAIAPFEREHVSQSALVPVAALRPAFAIRSSGEDEDHVRVLSAVEARLPPIVVHRETMRVLDGMHRLRAAQLRGATHVEVCYFTGCESDAFVVAVSGNVAHGLPLSLDDRRVAARRIIESHPAWSDRYIADVSGLAAKTVASLRSEASADGSPLRVGRDGRARPLDAVRGRSLAYQIMKANPAASLRRIASEAGISLSTASDVRQRLQRGDHPVPDRHRPDLEAVQERESPVAEVVRGRAQLWQHLRHDPSLRLTDTGRSLIRRLAAQEQCLRDLGELLRSAPAHCAPFLSELVRGFADD